MKKLLLVMTLPIFLLLQNASGEVTLPEGPGREMVYKQCQSCHNLARIKGTKRSQEGWRRIMGRMIRNGLKITQKEKRIILDYLETQFGVSS